MSCDNDIGGVNSFLVFINMNKANELQRSLAKRLNFKYDPPRGFLGFSNRDFRGFLKSEKTPHISGTYRGRSLRLGVVHFRGGFTDEYGYTIPQSFFSRIVMDIDNPSNSFMSLKTAGLLAQIAKAFGVEGIRTGQDAFDHRFMIMSRPKEFASSVFQSPELRDQLIRMRISFKIRVRENKLELHGTTNVELSYFRIFDLLCDIAEAIEVFSLS